MKYKHGKVYGDEKTNLELSKKAYLVYMDTFPLDIIEKENGLYDMHGIFDEKDITAEKVNMMLEELAE